MAALSRSNKWHADRGRPELSHAAPWPRRVARPRSDVRACRQYDRAMSKKGAIVWALMRRPVWALVVLASVVITLPSRAADNEPSASGAACPGAAAWNEAHAELSVPAMQRRDAARTLSRPDMLDELRRRVAADQAARRAMLANPAEGAVLREVTRVDADDDAWLRHLLEKDGLPGADQIGEFGLHLTWLLVQHADQDPQLQQWALAGFERRHAAGEFSADELARLTDRVLLKQGKTQRYGTQFDWGSGRFDPRHIDDVSDVDAHRRQLGLMPLADYACMMNSALERLAR